MKTIIITDFSHSEIHNLVGKIANSSETLVLNNIFIIETDSCDQDKEEESILEQIKNFEENIEKSVMIIKFSGRENIVSEVGDVSPSMVIAISCNPNSRFYIEKPIDKILEIIREEWRKKEQ